MSFGFSFLRPFFERYAGYDLRVTFAPYEPEPMPEKVAKVRSETFPGAEDVAEILARDMQGVMMQKLGLITPEQAAKVNRMKDFLHLIDERIKSGGLSDEQVAFLERKKILKDGKVQNMNGFMFGIKNLEETIAEFGFDAKDFEDIQEISRSGLQSPNHIPESALIIKWVVSGVEGAKTLEHAALVLQQAGRGLDSVLRLANGMPDEAIAVKYNQFDRMKPDDHPALLEVQYIHKALNSAERNASVHGFVSQPGMRWWMARDAEVLLTGYHKAYKMLEEVRDQQNDPVIKGSIDDLMRHTLNVQQIYATRLASIDPSFNVWIHAAHQVEESLSTPAPSAV